jgi:threonine synthase
VALAGLEKLKEQISVLDTIVVPLTGNGLKGAPNILGM